MRGGRPLVAVVIGVICGAVVLLLFFWIGGSTASVDEQAYVAHNEAVIRSVPQYPGAVLVNSYSIGVPRPGGLNENGPPYSAFDTWHIYQVSPPVPVQAVIRHFENLPGWAVSARVGNPINQVTLRKRDGLIYVVVSKSGYEVSVDYDGYGGPGH